MDSFTIKTIKVTIKLAEGEFDGGGDTVVIEGLPVKVDIDKPGGQDMNKMTMTVNGLKLKTMERLTVLAFKPLQMNNNVILVEVGNKDETLATVFSGEIESAVPVFSTNGSVSFKVEAATGTYPNKIASEPVSVKGVVSVSDLMQQFADEAGYSFINKGISMSVKNSIFRGSPILKIKKLARQVGIDFKFDDRQVVIFPKNEPASDDVVKLSSESGLFGYPSFTSDGIDVNCFYDPRLTVGGLVELKSIVPRASGTWKITKLSHKLEAYQTSGGSWKSAFSAVLAGDDK